MDRENRTKPQSGSIGAYVNDFLSQDSPGFRRAFWAFLSVYLCNKEVKNPPVPDLPQSKTDGLAEGNIFCSLSEAAEICVTFCINIG